MVERMPEEHGVGSSILPLGTKPRSAGKSEILNPKSETNSNDKIQIIKNDFEF